MRIEGDSIAGVMPKRTNNSETKSTGRADAADTGAVVVKLGEAARARADKGIDSEMQARIVELRTRIADGSYKVDVGRLADAIVSDELARSGGDL